MPIKTIQDLRDDLCESYDALKKDPRRLNQTKELANTAGKIIQSAALELQYAALRGEEPNIPFMGKTSGILLKPNAKLLKG